MKKTIKDYENYFIYDDGRVKNSITNKYLKGSIGEHGYHYYRLSKNNKKKMFYAHRLVAEAFIENPNNYPIVNHKDGNKQNNQVNNLEWVTASENVKHAHENNLLTLSNSSKRREYYLSDLAGEEWKVLSNLPYSISNLGRVKNDRTQVLLKPSISCGYYKVRPSVEGKPKDIIIHNAVYCVFNNIEQIPTGYVVDHIDGNKLNNCLQNLRLITLSENVKSALYETKTNLSAKKVGQYNLEGKFIKDFPSVAIAARELKLDSSTISKVCRGINKTHGGFIFKYM